jgi:putative sterol carrier protein
VRDTVLPALASALESGGEAAFAGFVRRSDDKRLERLAGSDAGLRVIFTGMARRFLPEKADGFEGDIQYVLPASDGAVKAWVVEIGRERATVRPGRAGEPRLTVELALADFIRLVARDLDPGKALMTGRLKLDGDFEVAAKLGVMFGEPAPY